MATITPYDENLPESDELFYLNSNMIDNEPFYNNFTIIENSKNYSTKPNQSIPSVDGYIFNLIKIIEDIGYNPRSVFLHKRETRYTHSLLNLIFTLGGAFGPLSHIRRSNIDKQYFQKWYLEKYQRSASMTQICRMIKKTTHLLDNNQSNIHLLPPVSCKLTSKQMDEEDEKTFQKRIQHMYGFDDVDTISTMSSRRSSIDEINSVKGQPSSPIILSAIDNSKPKQITIREYYPSKDKSSVMVNRSLSPSILSQQINDNYDYDQIIHDHPEVYNDPNPEFIRKPNPQQVTYKQNVSVRYLVPPTPPPPGPLIIREVLPPRQPTPPPLIIHQQDPSPPTPPPLILREAPPPLPPYQPAQIITKMLPQEPPAQRVVIEHSPQLPRKPQSIIIEKWLPYKPAPPREVIYERITEPQVLSEFEPTDRITTQQRRHSAEYHSQSTSSGVSIPVHVERQNSVDHIPAQQSSLFNQIAMSTHQQLQTMQRQTFEQIQAHHQWIANQHQQRMNMFLPLPTQLTTPALVVNHPPVTRTYRSFAAQQEHVLYQPTFM